MDPIEEFHALTAEHPFLPRQGQMVGVLAHRHLRQETRSRQPLLDRRHRLAGRDHRTAFGAGVLLAGFLDHRQRGRNELQPLADFLADVSQVLGAVRAVLLFGRQIEHHAAAR